MSPELQELLFTRHGRILGRLQGSGAGIACGDGWFDLLDLLCTRLQFHTDADGATQVVAVQIKEKFGTLRFHAEGADEMHEGMIDLARALCERLRQDCTDRPLETTSRSGSSEEDK